MSELVRERVHVYGRVQGVFFRDTCRREAAKAGVAGWVRNAEDGSVEAVFEGEPEGVRAMCRWCAVGPPHAEVERVETTTEQPVGERAFSVRD